MSRPLSVIGAVLIKDIRLLWFLAGLAIALRLLNISLHDLDKGQVSGPVVLLAFFISITAVFLCGLTAASVVQQDAAVSLEHDWLTRPIPRPLLVTAKALFIGAVLPLTQFIGELVWFLTHGYALQEALLAAGADVALALVVIPLVLAVAAVTSNLIEAAAACIGLVALLAGAALGADLLFPMQLPEGSGLSWIAIVPTALLLLAASLLVLWLQYARRATLAARLVLAATVAATPLLIAFLPWSLLFGVQKAFSADPAAAQPISLSLPAECLPAEAAKLPQPGQSGEPGDRLEALRWDDDAWKAAATGPVAFLTPVKAVGVPAGWRLVADGWRATYVAPDGAVVARPGAAFNRYNRTLDDHGVLTPEDGWIVSRANLERARQLKASLRLDYALTLLKPAASAVIPADGKRRKLEGIGYCGVDRRSNGLRLTCFTPFGHPSMASAEIEGVPMVGCRSCTGPGYTPGPLIGLGRSWRIELPYPRTPGSWRLKINTYDARAHFERTVVAPGVLGGPAAACPAPPRT